MIKLQTMEWVSYNHWKAQVTATGMSKLWPLPQVNYYQYNEPQPVESKPQVTTSKMSSATASEMRKLSHYIE